MAALDGRVAVITGAGRGIGREHALLFAREGAKVVVNDLGGDNAGQGADSGPAHDVVDEITGAGGAAVANTENIATWSGAESVVRQAIDEFGRLDVLVNNAGILRDSFIAGMAEAQWDAVIAVHLKGHFAMLHHAAAYWKARSKAGDTDLIMRDTVREFIDKEIRPQLDALETGEISPYPVVRKLFSEFGLDVLAAEAVKTMLDRERAREAEASEHRSDEGARSEASQSRPSNDEAAIAAGESEHEQHASSGPGAVGAQASMAAVLVSELAGVSIGLLSTIGVSLGLGAATIMSRGTLAQKER